MPGAVELGGGDGVGGFESDELGVGKELVFKEVLVAFEVGFGFFDVAVAVAWPARADS